MVQSCPKWSIMVLCGLILSNMVHMLTIELSKWVQHNQVSWSIYLKEQKQEAHGSLLLPDQKGLPMPTVMTAPVKLEVQGNQPQVRPPLIPDKTLHGSNPPLGERKQVEDSILIEKIRDIHNMKVPYYATKFEGRLAKLLGAIIYKNGFCESNLNDTEEIMSHLMNIHSALWGVITELCKQFNKNSKRMLYFINKANKNFKFLDSTKQDLPDEKIPVNFMMLYYTLTNLSNELKNVRKISDDLMFCNQELCFYFIRFFDQSEFPKHTKKKHEYVPIVGRTGFGIIQLKTSQHKCQLCDKIISLDLQALAVYLPQKFIQMHLPRKNISLDTAQKLMKNNFQKP